jgi:hypothetical protein
MGSFARTTGGIGAAALVVLTASSPAAEAKGRRVITIPCSSAALSNAITTANGLGAATLRLARNCSYTITTPATATDGLPLITGDIALEGGPSTTIRRDPATAALFRVLNVATGAFLHVRGIAILNGNTAGLGGGIQAAGTLELSHITLSGNTAGNGGAIAVAAGARAVITRTVIAANPTKGVGGGGLINFGVLTLTESHVTGNSAPINGGGLNTQPSGTSRIIRVTLDHNSSGGLGGGISNLGTTILENTLVEHNKGSAGGGIATGNTNFILRRSIVRRNTPDNCSPLNTIPGCSG